MRTVDEAKSSAAAQRAAEVMKTSKEIVADATRAAVEESARAVEAAPSPGPRLPQIIQLTDVERIKAENLNLKMRLLEAEYQATRKQILDADREWTASVSQRLGVDLTKYTLDFSSGTGVLLTPSLAKAIGAEPKVS